MVSENSTAAAPGPRPRSCSTTSRRAHTTPTPGGKSCASRPIPTSSPDIEPRHRAPTSSPDIERGVTIVLITRDHAVAAQCRRRLRIDGGRLRGHGAVPEAQG